MHALLSPKLAVKLPFILVSTGVAMAIAISVASYLNQRQAMLDHTQEDFGQTADRQQGAVVEWYEGIAADLQTMAQNPTARSGLIWLSNAWDEGSEGAGDAIREAYVEGNPFDPAERSSLDRAEGGLMYNHQHGQLHPYFRLLSEQKDYSDVFLINSEGLIVYTVAKTQTFGRAVADAPDALAEAHQRALNAGPGATAFVEFAGEQNSSFGGAAYFATMVVDDAGRPQGVLAYEVARENLERALVSGMDAGSGHRALLLNRSGDTLAVAGLGTADVDRDVIMALVEATQSDAETYRYDVTGVTGLRVATKAAPVALGDADWTLILEVDLATLLAPVVETRDKMFLIGGLGTLIVLLIGLVLARTITVPVARISENMKAISKGDYERDHVDARRRDELGVMATTLADFADKIRLAEESEAARARQIEDQRQVVDVMAGGLERLAQSNFAEPIEGALAQDYETLRAHYNDTVKTLSSTLAELAQTAKNIRSGADNISHASDDLSHRTETTAATLEQTAAAIDELTNSVKSAADRSKSVDQIVVDATAEARKSNEIVKSAMTAMTEIENSSAHISQIIGVIDDIAFQTNLLALNAGVEAARAGDAGRGFAVVASEVRGLAQRSSNAAKEIKELITGSAAQVQTGVSLVSQTGEALDSITSQVSHISTLVSEIATGAAEQAVGLGEINTGMSQLGAVTQQNATMVEEVTAAGHALRSNAQSLSEMVEAFRITKDELSEESLAEDENVGLFQSERRNQVVDEDDALDLPIEEEPVLLLANDRESWRDF